MYQKLVLESRPRHRDALSGCLKGFLFVALVYARNTDQAQSWTQLLSLASSARLASTGNPSGAVERFTAQAIQEILGDVQSPNPALFVPMFLRDVVPAQNVPEVTDETVPYILRYTWHLRRYTMLSRRFVGTDSELIQAAILALELVVSTLIQHVSLPEAFAGILNLQERYPRRGFERGSYQGDALYEIGEEIRGRIAPHARSFVPSFMKRTIPRVPSVPIQAM